MVSVLAEPGKPGNGTAEVKPLAEDLPDRGVDSLPVALHGREAGVGFAQRWHVQNNVTEGYVVAERKQMSFGELVVSGLAVVGGESYLAAGRPLALAEWSGLTRRVDQNGGEVTVLGAPGTTVWLSVLLEKSAENDQMVYVSLHGSTVPWLTGDRVIAAGYFGEPSQRSGARVWALEVAPGGGADGAGGRRERLLLPTTVAVEPGKPVLLVVAMHVDVPTTPTTATESPQAGPSGVSRVELYVNPSVLGGDPPARPDASQTLPTDALRVHSVAIHLGDGPAQGSMAALRLGRSFAAVTPTKQSTEAGKSSGQ
jgi:hypothetical protein